MKVLDRQLNAWQFAIMMFTLFFANKILVLPSLLFKGAKFEAIFIPVVLFLFEMGVLWLFYLLKSRFPDESFSSLLKKYCGRVVQIIVYVLFALFFLSKAVLLYNVTFIFFRNVIYKDYTNFLFLFCMLPIFNHLAASGLRALGRTLQLFFPVIVTIIVFCLVVGVFGIDNVPLFFEGTFSGTLLELLKHFGTFGDVIFAFLIMDRVKIKKGQWKIVFCLSSTSAIFVVAICVIYILSYSYTIFLHPYAIFEIVSFVKEYSGLGRLDIVPMVLIMIFAYFHLAIYLKGFMFSFHGIFKCDQIYSLLTFDFLFLLIINVFIINLEDAIIYAQGILPFFTIIPFVIIPLFIAVFFARAYGFGFKKKIKKKIGEVQNE